MPFVNACSKFLYLDNPESATPQKSGTKKNTKSDTKLINLLRQAIEAHEDDDGWATLGPVGSHISNQASFDQRNYGFAKLSDLFKSIDLFELEKTKELGYRVRDKRKKK
jgi:uncharacterized LabA/DUF88 family protein